MVSRLGKANLYRNLYRKLAGGAREVRVKHGIRHKSDISITKRVSLKGHYHIFGLISPRAVQAGGERRVRLSERGRIAPRHHLSILSRSSCANTRLIFW